MSSQEGPITPLREQAREAGAAVLIHPQDGCQAADAASDVWEAEVERLRDELIPLTSALRAWLEHVGPPSGAFGQSMTATMAYTAIRDLRAAAAKYLSEQTADV